MSRRGWVLFIAMGVIWGIPYLMIKVAVTALTPASLVLMRTGLAALLLLPLAFGRGQVRPVLRAWRPLLAFAIIEMAIPWMLLSSAERTLSSSLSGLLIAAVPLVGAVLGWITRTDRLGPRRLLGLGVGLVGVGALVGLDFHGGNVPALLEITGVVVCYAVGPFILARYLSDLPGLGVTASSLAIVTIGYAPVGIAQLPDHWPAANVIGAVLTLAIVCTAVAFLVFFALIDEVGPVRATVITYVNPAVAVALGVTLLGEPFTVGIGIGFVLVLAGSILATRRGAPTPAAPAHADERVAARGITGP